MTRQYTNKILELKDDGILDADRLVHQLLLFMSEADVKEFYITYYRDELEPDDED